MKGIIYVRVSSGEQVAGTSLNYQKQLCKEYCAKNDIKVVKVFCEEGASAKSSNRKKFLEAIEYCRKNKIEAFVVHKVDRFARNTEDHFIVKAKLLKYGTSLYSVSEPIGDSPSGKLFETILAGFSDFDNEIRKIRCVDGMSEKINQGIYAGKAPIGYIPHPNRKIENLRKEKKNLPDVPHPDIAPILKITLKEYANGLHTMKSFMDALDERGFATFRGKKTYFSYIESILEEKRLKFYAGELFNPWTKQTVQGLHEPLISYDEALDIIDILKGKKSKRHKAKTRINPTFPLRGGTLICEECQKPITGSSPVGNGGKYHYYHCGNKKCSLYGKTFRKKEVEDAFIKLLEKITPEEKFVNLFKKAVLERLSDKFDRNKKEKELHERKLKQLKQKRERIFTMYENGDYSPEDFQERKSRVENEITTCEISSHEAHIEELDAEMVLDEAKSFITSLSNYWSKRIDINIKPRFQKYLFPNGIVYIRNRGFRTADLALTFRLNQEFVEHNSNDVEVMGIERNFCATGPSKSPRLWRSSANIS